MSTVLRTLSGLFLAGLGRVQRVQERQQDGAGQYAVTVYGANVRALCGADVLPVPAGTDTPRIVVRKPRPKPSKPPEKPVTPKP